MKTKPFSMTFYQLMVSTQALHQWQKSYIDLLHDVWLAGAPTPDSRLLNPKAYDPRKVQAGNVEKRLVIPTKFVEWFNDVAKRRNLPLEADTAQRAYETIARNYRIVRGA